MAPEPSDGSGDTEEHPPTWRTAGLLLAVASGFVVLLVIVGRVNAMSSKRSKTLVTTQTPDTNYQGSATTSATTLMRVKALLTQREV